MCTCGDTYKGGSGHGKGDGDDKFVWGVEWTGIHDIFLEGLIFPFTVKRFNLLGRKVPWMHALHISLCFTARTNGTRKHLPLYTNLNPTFNRKRQSESLNDFFYSPFNIDFLLIQIVVPFRNSFQRHPCLIWSATENTSPKKGCQNPQ